MGKSSPSPPPAPDPAQTAAAQGAANLETAIGQGYLNATNQVTPYGTVTFDQTGTVDVGGKTVPRFTQTTSLSPEQQQQLNLTNALRTQALGMGQNVLGNVGNAIGQPFSFDGLPQAPGINDFSADRDKVTQALIARNQPQIDRSEESTRARLLNMGAREGSEAWRAGMDDLARQQNDFNLAAINAGGAEQSRLFGLGQQARQQGIQERAFQRSQPINEYATLLGLGGNVQAPQFNSPQTQIAPTDVIGPTALNYQGQMAAWNARNNANQSTMGNLFGLGSALGSAWIGSDIRIKENIRRVGTLDNGLPVYTFTYKSGGPVHMGVMAQDVEKVNPSAVKEIGGIKHVDYGRIA